MAKESGYVQVKLPSGEVKRILGQCYATIGVLGNDELRNACAGKAGILRHRGWRPAVRGVAMSDPKNDHPHAGSYSKTGIGMKAPKSPWGWKTLGVKSRKRTRTNYTIIKKRKGK